MADRGHDDRTLVVLMNGVHLGEVYQDRARRVRLRYDDSYAHRPDAVPLSMSMPLVSRRYKHAELSPWLTGLLPDRPDVLARWRREFRVNEPSSFALLRHVGEDVAGAAQFVKPERVAEASGPGPVEPLTAEEVAELISRLRRDPSAWEPSAGEGRFSLAGAQAKTALHFDNGWGLPTGRTPSTHIIKPAISDLADQDINEHMSMRAARLLGMTVPDSRVERFGDERAFVVTRYDRVRTIDGWMRVHQEDMCQALGVVPDKKYEEHGGPGAADIARLIRDSVTRENAERDVERFADAIIYNWLIVGTDAHAKNYSLLLAPGQVRLAPLYDLNSYLPYRGRKKPEMSMRVGSHKSRPDLIGAEDWAAFAKSIGISNDYVTGRIKEMAAEAPSAFSDVGKADAIRDIGSDLPGRLVDAVDEWVARCIAAMSHR